MVRLKAFRHYRVLVVILALLMICGTVFTLKVSAEVGTPTNSTTGLPVIGLEVHSFATSKYSSGNNASLNWGVDGIDDEVYFAIYKSSDGKDFEKCYVTNGNSWQDYELLNGHTYKYKVIAMNSDGNAIAASNEATFYPTSYTGSMNTHSNATGGELVYETSGTKVGNTYYSYSMKSNNGSYYLVESTSTDGVNFNTQRTVADKTQNSDLGSCKLESVQMKYVKNKNIMMIWAHWELPSGYDSGKALVITGTPGGTFTVHNIYNPLGVYVRDMAIFLDDDDTAYLVAASNVSGQGANATIYIFEMNDTYSDVTRVVKKLHENQYREFPCLVKRDGYYYLFTSQAAGWYPSQGGYAVTKSLDGEWSDLRKIGNASTFSSQSGWIQAIGDGDNCVMHAYRWISSSDTAGSTLCPVYFANGFAFYDYCTAFHYSMQSGALLPVQDGELLSLNKPVTSSISSSTLQNAVDGSYTNSFVGTQKTWPFNVQIDLLKESDLSNIQISWYMCKGSEGYYTYYVEGSTDGVNWTRLLDRTDESSDRVTKTYGFTSDELSGRARYVRLTVTNAHLHNNPNNNWYTPQIYEIKVFGKNVSTSSQTKTENQPVAVYHLDKTEITSGKITDKTGRNGDLVLYGNYGTDSVADTNVEQTKYFGKTTQPIYFTGSDGCYAQLPDGLLSGKDEFSISMRVRSEMDFSKAYFTLGLGNDNTQYLIFKLGKDKVRFHMTNNSWMGETGIKKDIDGNNWHTYTITVDETIAKLYIDGQLIGENYTMGTLLSDFGNSAKLYLGKSFFSSDQYFNGSISSICFYDYALSEENVAEMKNTVYYVGEDDTTEDESTEDESDQTSSGTKNIWTGSWDLKSWSSALEIAENLNGWSNASLKISFSSSSSAQLQLACIDKNGSWVQFVDYIDVNGSSYTHQLSDSDLETLQTAQKIVIKGQNAIITSVDIIGEGTNNDVSKEEDSSDNETSDDTSSDEDSSKEEDSSDDETDNDNTSSEEGSSSKTSTEIITDQTNGIYFDDGTWDWKEETVTYNAPKAGKYKVTVVAQSGDASAWFKVSCNNNALWEEGNWCDGNWTSVTKTVTVSMNAGENTFTFGGNMKVKYVSCIVCEE